MNIQIFGTKKSPDTRKAERFFKERGIKVANCVSLSGLHHTDAFPVDVRGVSRAEERDEWGQANG